MAITMNINNRVLLLNSKTLGIIALLLHRRTWRTSKKRLATWSACRATGCRKIAACSLWIATSAYPRTGKRWRERGMPACGNAEPVSGSQNPSGFCQLLTPLPETFSQESGANIVHTLHILSSLDGSKDRPRALTPGPCDEHCHLFAIVIELLHRHLVFDSFCSERVIHDGDGLSERRYAFFHRQLEVENSSLT